MLYLLWCIQTREHNSEITTANPQYLTTVATTTGVIIACYLLQVLFQVLHTPSYLRLNQPLPLPLPLPPPPPPATQRDKR